MPLSKRVSQKSLFKERGSKVHDKSVLQECLCSVPRKSAPQEFPARVSQTNPSLTGLAWLFGKAALQECITGVSFRIPSQECFIRLNEKSSVFRNCVLRVSCKHRLQCFRSPLCKRARQVQVRQASSKSVLQGISSGASPKGVSGECPLDAPH